jgi:hypothetical protein
MFLFCGGLIRFSPAPHGIHYGAQCFFLFRFRKCVFNARRHFLIHPTKHKPRCSRSSLHSPFTVQSELRVPSCAHSYQAVWRSEGRWLPSPNKEGVRFCAHPLLSSKQEILCLVFAISLAQRLFNPIRFLMRATRNRHP